MASSRRDELTTPVMDLWREGATMIRIAEQLRCSATTVKLILDDHGVTRAEIVAQVDRKRRRLREPAERKLVSRYESGSTLKEMAAEFGVSVGTIWNIVRRHNPDAVRRVGGPRKWVTPEEMRQVADLRKQGLTQLAIAQQLVTSQSRVSKILRSQGMRTREPRAKGVVTAAGYIYVWIPDDHRFAAMRQKLGYVAEHRLAMAESLGRPLESHETVHHVNGDKADNRLENLQLRSGHHGKGARFVCLDCGSSNVAAATI